MTQTLAHQFLSLSLAALLTVGVLAGLAQVADQQHHSATIQFASPSLVQPAARSTALVTPPAALPVQRRS